MHRQCFGVQDQTSLFRSNRINKSCLGASGSKSVHNFHPHGSVHVAPSSCQEPASQVLSCCSLQRLFNTEESERKMPKIDLRWLLIISFGFRRAALQMMLDHVLAADRFYRSASNPSILPFQMISPGGALASDFCWLDGRWHDDDEYGL